MLRFSTQPSTKVERHFPLSKLMTTIAAASLLTLKRCNVLHVGVSDILYHIGNEYEINLCVKFLRAYL